MKQLLLLLRHFLVPFNGWPWLYYIGLALLPVLLLTGLFYPRVAFGLALWDYTLLVAIPFSVAPKLLRTLLCNRRLSMTPGLQRSVIASLLLFTLIHSSFVGIFAMLYQAYGDPLTHLRNAVQLFIVDTLYIIVMQYAVTTSAAVLALSTLPVLSAASVLYITQGMGSDPADSLMVLLLLLALGSWVFALIHIPRQHGFRSEHETVLGYRYAEFQRPPLAQWLLHGSNALAAPDATLMLGYPANLLTRVRVTLYLLVPGPLLAAMLISAWGYGSRWQLPPSMLDLFIGCSLMPAMFQAFQCHDWAARLRLIWLRRPALRSQLWQFLEKQLVINVAVVIAISLGITVAGLLFSGIPADVLPHYPLLVLLFNFFFGYYMVCARIGEWSTLSRILLIWASTVLMWAAISVAIRSDNHLGLYALEAMTFVAAVCMRSMARDRLCKVDWLRVKPGRSASPALSST